MTPENLEKIEELKKEYIAKAQEVSSDNAGIIWAISQLENDVLRIVNAYTTMDQINSSVWEAYEHILEDHNCGPEVEVILEEFSSKLSEILIEEKSKNKDNVLEKTPIEIESVSSNEDYFLNKLIWLYEDDEDPERIMRIINMINEYIEQKMEFDFYSVLTFEEKSYITDKEGAKELLLPLISFKLKKVKGKDKKDIISLLPIKCKESIELFKTLVKLEWLEVKWNTFIDILNTKINNLIQCIVRNDSVDWFLISDIYWVLIDLEIPAQNYEHFIRITTTYYNEAKLIMKKNTLEEVYQQSQFSKAMNEIIIIKENCDEKLRAMYEDFFNYVSIMLPWIVAKNRALEIAINMKKSGSRDIADISRKMSKDYWPPKNSIISDSEITISLERYLNEYTNRPWQATRNIPKKAIADRLYCDSETELFSKFRHIPPKVLDTLKLYFRYYYNYNINYILRNERVTKETFKNPRKIIIKE